jgi:hypothetical protein
MGASPPPKEHSGGGGGGRRQTIGWESVVGEQRCWEEKATEKNGGAAGFRREVEKAAMDGAFLSQVVELGRGGSRKKESTRGMENGEALRQDQGVYKAIKQWVEGDGSGEFVLLARTVAQSSRLLLHLHVCSSLFFLNNQSRVLSFFL